MPTFWPIEIEIGSCSQFSGFRRGFPVGSIQDSIFRWSGFWGFSFILFYFLVLVVSNDISALLAKKIMQFVRMDLIESD